MRCERELAQHMSDIARRLRRPGQGREEVIEQIVHAAIAAVPGTHCASITLTEPGLADHCAATSDLARAAHHLQHQIAEGPTLITPTPRDGVWIEDTAVDTRWPAFSPVAEALGIRSMHCVRLQSSDQIRLGTLTLYSTTAYAFDAQTRTVALVFAAHAAVAWSAAYEIEQLRVGLINRDVIGQAKGMLMERYKITADRAFGLLATLSQNDNIKLAVVAQQVLDAGPETP